MPEPACLRDALTFATCEESLGASDISRSSWFSRITLASARVPSMWAAHEHMRTRKVLVCCMTLFRLFRLRKGHRTRPISRQMRFRTDRPMPSCRAASCRDVRRILAKPFYTTPVPGSSSTAGPDPP